MNNSFEVELKNASGMHARPAAELAKLASSFKSDVNIKYGSKIVNGKSIIGILTLGARQGRKLLFNAYGPDSVLAIEKIKHFFENYVSDDN